MLALLKCQYYSVLHKGKQKNWTLSIRESAEGDYLMVKASNTGQKHEEYHLTYDEAEYDLECTHDKWISNGAELKGAIEFELFKVEEEL